MTAVQGLLSIEVNGRTVGTFGIVHYIVGVDQVRFHCSNDTGIYYL